MTEFESPIDDFCERLREEEQRLLGELGRVRAMLVAATVTNGQNGTERRLRDTLVAAPKRVWTAVELRVEIGAQGWVSPSPDPTNAVRAALSRGVEAGWVERVDRGRFRAVPGGGAA